MARPSIDRGRNHGRRCSVARDVLATVPRFGGATRKGSWRTEMIADPLSIFRRAANKFNTVWLRSTYPFAKFGRGVSIDVSCDISRHVSEHVYLGDDVYLAADIWLNTLSEAQGSTPKIFVGKGCRIGRRCTISARNSVRLGEDVLLAPSVLIMDHNH